jgi:hypothetical protein
MSRTASDEEVAEAKEFMEPPWKKALKSKHQQQEERIGRMPGGSKQPASGRIWRFARDAVLMGFLIEARTTDKRKYTIDLDEWLKIEREAHMTPPGLLPGMQIDIDGHQLIVTRLVDFTERENRLGASD